MKNFLSSMQQQLRGLAVEEDGAQIIEYALIVAVVSLGLILLVQSGLLGNSGGFSDWLDDVTTCLTAATCSRT